MTEVSTVFTAVFEVFEYRYKDVEIVNREKYHQENIFCGDS
jgi:hypothetical protein